MLANTLLVILCLLITACHGKAVGLDLETYVPSWASSVDVKESSPSLIISYEYSGEPYSAVLYTDNVLASIGYEECNEKNVGWHEYSANRNGKLINAQRYLKFYFRLEEPSVAYIEVFKGPLTNTALISVNNLDSSEVLLFDKSILCQENG